MSTEMTLDQIATDINAMCVCRHCDEWVSGIRAEIAKKSGGEQPVAWMASHAGGAIVGDAERTAIMARRGGNGSTYPIPLYAAPRHTGEVTDEMVETGIAVWKRETRCDVSQGLMRMVLRECFAAQPKAEVVQPVEAVAMLVEAKTKLARAVGTAESGPSKLWVREVNSAAWDIKRAMDALAHPRPMACKCGTYCQDTGHGNCRYAAPTGEQAVEVGDDEDFAGKKLPRVRIEYDGRKFEIAIVLHRGHHFVTDVFQRVPQRHGPANRRVWPKHKVGARVESMFEMLGIEAKGRIEDYKALKSAPGVEKSS